VATFQVGTQLEPYQRVHAFGTEGWIEVEVPFNPPPMAPARIVLHAGRETLVHKVAEADQYALQGEAFARAAKRGGPSPVSLHDALANVRVLDAVRTAAASGRWVDVARGPLRPVADGGVS
jgi:predicted dehydrogenase